MRQLLAGLIAGLGLAVVVGSCSASGGGGDNGGAGGSGQTGGSAGDSALDTTINIDTSTGCPSTCAELGAECGAATDAKCGGVVQCGNCPTGQSCGAGGPNKCALTQPDGSTCTPLTCAGQQVTCGQAGDGCGGQLSCGACGYPKICGGGGTPGQCGCTGLCAQIADCTGGTPTTLKGKVYDPAGLNPLYNALVYVPNNPNDPGLTSFPVGPKCELCGATAAGDPLITTNTAADGSFTLTNVPVGASVPVVIQLGRWRRVFTVNVSASCAANTVSGAGITNGILKMPKNKSEGNIPLTAIVTGNADALECVFLKMGIDQAEFTNPSGNGRIHLYQGGGVANVTGLSTIPNNIGYTNCSATAPYSCTLHGAGARIDTNTPSEATLFQGATMAKYDMVVLSCEGRQFSATENPSVGNYQQLVSYTSGGGRMFASHYADAYMVQGAAANPFYGTAAWNLNAAGYTSQVGIVDTVSNPKGSAFAKWLETVGALSATNPPQLTINDPRKDVNSVIAPTQRWLYFLSGTIETPLHFTFNTPIGAAPASQCGRGLFSDFHVVLTAGSSGQTGTYNLTFPAECSGPMTAQEKVLEFMIFDLGACVDPYKPLCVPQTCASQGFSCGPAGDGCGKLLQCGTCPPGTFCGGGGKPGVCGAADGGGCTPLTCAGQGIQCGPAGDGCGNALDCGNCPPGQVCGLTSPGKCGSVN